ncbi:MAG: MBL fold metallo-hydrolase [Oryzomonas sp.]
MTQQNGIIPLRIAFSLNGEQREITPTLIRDRHNTILVDAGFPGQEPLFIREFERIGLDPVAVNGFIVTHQDRDHIGGLSQLLESAAPGSPVAAHGLERAYIQGQQQFIKNPHRDNPPPAPPFARVAVTRVLVDGEELPYAGGVVVIHTPGHTPGHICLYHRQSRTMISGDALNVVDGELTGPNPRFTHDLPLALSSLKRLSRYDIDTVICYHGGVFRYNVSQRIADIADGLRAGR